jgi:7-carboxy-7-deazaguanine synthase
MEMSVDQILDKVESMGMPFVCLTGGEPMVQEDIYKLIDALLENNFHVTIETNGSVPLQKLPNSDDILISMDIKCPSSGMSDKMCYDNLEFLSPRDQLKFIISDRVDYLFAKKVLRENEVNAPIIMTPVGGTNMKELADWVLRDKIFVRVMPQLHKLIWGDKRGV